MKASSSPSPLRQRTVDAPKSGRNLITGTSVTPTTFKNRNTKISHNNEKKDNNKTLTVHHYHHYDTQKHVHIYHEHRNNPKYHGKQKKRKRRYILSLLRICIFGGIVQCLWRVRSLMFRAHTELQNTELQIASPQKQTLDPLRQRDFVYNHSKGLHGRGWGETLQIQNVLLSSFSSPVVWSLVKLHVQNSTASHTKPTRRPKFKAERNELAKSREMLQRWCPQPYLGSLESPKLVQSSEFAFEVPPDPSAQGIFHYASLDYLAFYKSKDAIVDEILAPVSHWDIVSGNTLYIRNATIVETKNVSSPQVQKAAVCKIRSDITVRLQHFAHAMEELYKCYDYWIESGCGVEAKNTNHYKTSDSTNTTMFKIKPILLFDETTQGKFLMHDSFLHNTFMKGIKEFLKATLDLTILTTDDYYQCHFDYVDDIGGVGGGITEGVRTLREKTICKTLYHSNQTNQTYQHYQCHLDFVGDSGDVGGGIIKGDRTPREKAICKTVYHPDQTIRTYKHSSGENGFLFQHSFEWNEHMNSYLKRKYALRKKLLKYSAKKHQIQNPNEKNKTQAWTKADFYEQKKARNKELREELMRRKRLQDESKWRRGNWDRQQQQPKKKIPVSRGVSTNLASNGATPLASKAKELKEFSFLKFILGKQKELEEQQKTLQAQKEKQTQKLKSEKENEANAKNQYDVYAGDKAEKDKAEEKPDNVEMEADDNNNDKIEEVFENKAGKEKESDDDDDGVKDENEGHNEIENDNDGEGEEKEKRVDVGDIDDFAKYEADEEKPDKVEMEADDNGHDSVEEVVENERGKEKENDDDVDNVDGVKNDGDNEIENNNEGEGEGENEEKENEADVGDEGDFAKYEAGEQKPDRVEAKEDDNNNYNVEEVKVGEIEGGYEKEDNVDGAKDENDNEIESDNEGEGEGEGEGEEKENDANVGDEDDFAKYEAGEEKPEKDEAKDDDNNNDNVEEVEVGEVEGGDEKEDDDDVDTAANVEVEAEDVIPEGEPKLQNFRESNKQQTPAIEFQTERGDTWHDGRYYHQRRRLTSSEIQHKPNSVKDATLEGDNGSVLEGACARPPRIAILNRQNSRTILNAKELAADLSELVYVYARNDSGAKNPTNTNATLEDKHQFEYRSPSPVPVVFFEKKSFVEQVEFFQNTDIVISGHGAQLTGLPFMANDLDKNLKSCKHVLELYPKNYALPYYFGSLAVQSGLGHSYVYYDDGLRGLKYEPRKKGQWPIARPPLKDLKHKRGPLLDLKPWARVNADDYTGRIIARKYRFCPRRDDMIDYVATLILEWYRCHGC